MSIAFACCFLEILHCLAASKLLSLRADRFGTSSIADTAEAERFVDLTHGSDTASRVKAYDGLEEIGPVYPGAIPTLITGLADDTAPDAFFPCKQALSDFGLRALPALTEATEALESYNHQIRGRCVNLIGQLGRAASQSTATLLDRLKHENDGWVKGCLLSTLRDIGGDIVAAHPGALKLIYSCLLDGIARENNSLNVSSCLSIISTSGEAGKVFVPKLLELLTEHNPQTHKPYGCDSYGLVSIEICNALAHLVFDQVTESSPYIMLSPKPDDAKFNLEIARYPRDIEPTVRLNGQTVSIVA